MSKLADANTESSARLALPLLLFRLQQNTVLKFCCKLSYKGAENDPAFTCEIRCCRHRLCSVIHKQNSLSSSPEQRTQTTARFSITTPDFAKPPRRLRAIGMRLDYCP